MHAGYSLGWDHIIQAQNCLKSSTELLIQICHQRSFLLSPVPHAFYFLRQYEQNLNWLSLLAYFPVFFFPRISVEKGRISLRRSTTFKTGIRQHLCTEERSLHKLGGNWQAELSTPLAQACSKTWQNIIGRAQDLNQGTLALPDFQRGFT